MRVVVGSENPNKLASTRLAFEKVFAGQEIDVIGQTTDSGVSDQPMSIPETIEGAINRAKNASSEKADFSVGIEGGLSLHDIKGEEICLEISFVCVNDCKTGKYEISSAHGFRIFPNVLGHIRAGKNLSDAMESEYGIKEIGKNSGVVGWLTDDEISRQTSARDGVLLALSALLKEERI
jgi:inosine/xanthosine triphosphatase